MTEDVATYDTGTPVSTPQLDPAAVEAAAKVYWINATGRNDTRGSMAWSEQSDVLQETIRDTITSNITAFIAHIEPKLRERVIAYNDTTWDCVVAQERGMAQAEVSKRYKAFQDAATALYALFGLEAS